MLKKCLYRHIDEEVAINKYKFYTAKLKKYTIVVTRYMYRYIYSYYGND